MANDSWKVCIRLNTFGSNPGLVLNESGKFGEAGNSEYRKEQADHIDLKQLKEKYTCLDVILFYLYLSEAESYYFLIRSHDKPHNITGFFMTILIYALGTLIKFSHPVKKKQ